jgi:acyl CoA:acetate/3-ketoacid CoA transferase beta subunit
VFQRPDHDSPFKLIELAPGVSREDVREKTTANDVDGASFAPTREDVCRACCSGRRRCFRW